MNFSKEKGLEQSFSDFNVHTYHLWVKVQIPKQMGGLSPYLSKLPTGAPELGRGPPPAAWPKRNTVQATYGI